MLSAACASAMAVQKYNLTFALKTCISCIQANSPKYSYTIDMVTVMYRHRYMQH